MHLNDEQLRAHLDGELESSAEQQAQNHLARCQKCQERLQAIEQRAKRVRERMSASMIDSPAQPSTHLAYKRFSQHSFSREPKKEINQTMFTRRPLWAALTILVVALLALSLPTVQAWASGFLSLFRVQNVQVISFDPTLAEDARERLKSNRDLIEKVLKDNIDVEKKGEKQEVGSVDEAAEAAGFVPRLPSELPDLQLVVNPGMQGRVTIDQPKFQGLIDEIGMELDLPESVDGEVITVDVQSSVLAASGCDLSDEDKQAVEPGTGHRMAYDVPEDCTTLIQLPSPVIDAPEGLEVERMGEAMLQFIGLSPEEARVISERIDWTSTLLLPVPDSGEIEYQDVQVDGVTATFLREADEDRYTLIWVKDGRLYGLHGQGGPEEAIELASSLE